MVENVKVNASIKNKPHSDEAEQSLLACILVDDVAASAVAESMPHKQAFYNKVNATIYEAVLALIKNGVVPDLITVNDYLEKNKTADKGTLPYLTNLVSSVVSSANYKAYLDIVKRDYTARKLIDNCNEIIVNAYENSDINAVLNDAEKKIFSVGDSVRSGSLTHVSLAAADVISRIDSMMQQGADSFVTKTGYTAFDRKLGGLANSDLIILAARPAVGKTTFAQNLLLQIATQQQEKVIAFFSLEMSNLQLAQRMMANLSQVAINEIQSANINQESMERLWNASVTLGNTKIFLDDSSLLTPQNMISKCRKLVTENNRRIDLIVVDYLQLMAGEGNEKGRNEEISKISRMLKVMAKELNCPVLALSQMNRRLEQRDSKIPLLSDLRESGSIEQDADIVLFLFRDETPHEDCIVCKIAKHRHGESEVYVRFQFQKEINRFRESEDQDVKEQVYLNKSTNKHQSGD